jgi:hypothetical protein
VKQLALRRFAWFDKQPKGRGIQHLHSMQLERASAGAFAAHAGDLHGRHATLRDTGKIWEQFKVAQMPMLCTPICSISGSPRV